MKKIWEILPPVAADLLALCAYLFLFQRAAYIMNRKGLPAAALIAGAYIILCISVWAIRKLPGEKKSGLTPKKGFLGFLGIAFGVFTSYMIAETSGFFEWLDSISSNPADIPALWLFLGMILWFGFIMLFTVIIISKAGRMFTGAKSKIIAIEFFSLMGINLMIIITVIFWNSLFMDTVPYENLAFTGKVLIFIPSYLFFLLFFAAPRMFFILRSSGKTAAVTFILQTSFYVWDTLSKVAWK